MEGLKQVLNERFSRDDLKEYGVSFECKVEENQELILSYKNSKISVKTRDENLDDWICAANTYNSNKDKLSLESGFTYLSDLQENKIEFRLQTLKTVSNYISFSNIQEYKFNTEKGVVKIGFLSKNMIFSIFNSDLYKDLFLHRVLPSIESRLGRGIRRFINIEDIFRIRFKTAIFESSENLNNDNLKTILPSTRKLLNTCFY